jgi:two-component system NtrC family response regulator
LANVIEHATILCEYPPILPDHLPRHFVDRRLRKEVRSGTAGSNASVPLVSMPLSLKELESLAVQEAVNRHNGNKPAAAEELGISLKTLYNKLNQADPANKKAA